MFFLNHKLRFLVVALLLLVSGNGLWGADGQRYAPVIPKADYTPPQMPVRKTETPKIDENQVLIPELKGLLFVDMEERVYSISPESEGIQADSYSNFAFEEWPEFKPALEKYIGKPVSIAMLTQLQKEIQEIYRNRSISFVGVQFPAQNAENGTRQVLLLEGKIKSVKVEGARFFNNERLEKGLYVEEGNYFDDKDAREDIIWLNQNPFRTVEIDVKPAEEGSGDLDVRYKVKDMFPFRSTIGYIDTGTKGTGVERVFAGGTYGNLFGRSNLLNYQLTSSPDMETIVNHSVMWRMPFAETRNYLTVHGSYATLKPVSYQEGRTWGSGFALNRRLWTKSKEDYRRTATFSMGFDFLQTNTDLDVGGTYSAEIPVETAQFNLGFNWTHQATDGYIGFSSNLHISPGGFSKYNNTEYFQAFAGNTDVRADYMFLTLELDMLRKLENMDVHWRLFGQVSNSALIAYDQMGLGGTNSVRGYYQYTDERDGGLIMNLELLTPSKSGFFGEFMQKVPPYHNLMKHYEDDFQLYTFLDVGVGIDWAEDSEDSESVTLAGAGVGARYSFGPWINIDFAYGFQLLDPKDEEYDKTGRPHLSVVICR